MDPQTAWNELLEALAGKDLIEAEIRAEALLDWFDKGGFAPQTVGQVLPAEWDRLICRYLCRKVIIAATPPWE